MEKMRGRERGGSRGDSAVELDVRETHVVSKRKNEEMWMLRRG